MYTARLASLLTSGTTLFKASSGVVYLVTTGGIIGSGGYVECTLNRTDTGDIRQHEDGAELRIVTGPTRTWTVPAIVTGQQPDGADAETEASFRSRVNCTI